MPLSFLVCLTVRNRKSSEREAEGIVCPQAFLVVGWGRVGFASEPATWCLVLVWGVCYLHFGLGQV